MGHMIAESIVESSTLSFNDDVGDVRDNAANRKLPEAMVTIKDVVAYVDRSKKLSFGGSYKMPDKLENPLVTFNKSGSIARPDKEVVRLIVHFFLMLHGLTLERPKDAKTGIKAYVRSEVEDDFEKDNFEVIYGQVEQYIEKYIRSDSL